MGLLDGKVIIQGGAGEIGSACARRYAREGASVVVADIDLDHAQAVARSIVETGGKAIGARLDGAEDASAAEVVALARSTFGALHGMHVNFVKPSVAAHADGIDMPLDMFDECIRVNARGYLVCSRQAIPAIIESGGGAMLYTSSVDSYNGPVERIAYVMSKSAINGLMRAVAQKYGPQGLRANCIAPGVILHARMDAREGEPWKAEQRALTLLKTRLGKTEDIAAMGALLLSNDGGFVTGQVISVDGGWSYRP
jgi:NAD(P)-dependent dehydrogenase (short-subunit alcohol dehydrogenase family)